MTEAELSAARAVINRAEELLRVSEKLKIARARLALLNQHGKTGTTWTTKIILKERTGSWSDDSVSLSVSIPFGVIQQQAVYAVAKLERMLIRAGGAL